MKISASYLSYHFIFLHLFFFINKRDATRGITYDYRATTECLKEPWDALYGGGIIDNPKFDEGVKGWSVFGDGKVEERIMKKNGNKFAVAFNRTLPSDGLTQRIQLEQGKLYAFSAWIQISEGSEIVAVKFRHPCGEKYLHGGTVIVEQGCWSMLKGGIVANFSGPVYLTFETNNTCVEVWVDSVSLQPFTKKQWKLHQETTIAKVRKRKVKFQVINKNNITLKGAKITLKQMNPGFPVGCEINLNILNSTKYKNWFLSSRFTVTAFGNEMKWYFTEEKLQGKENYTISDAMLQLCEQNNIRIRGHNIFWDDPKYQPKWLKPEIKPENLKELVKKRLKSVVLRYKGRLLHWDVMNENLHFDYYEDKLGENASAEIFAEVHKLDRKPRLFMNEYNTIEVSEDGEASPSRYARKLNKIGAYYRGKSNNKLPLGVGLESRFGSNQPNFAYMRAGIDYLASMGFPVWLTEVFVDKGENQAKYLEEVLREGYSHPGVEGIVIWPTSPFSRNCKMCLIDINDDFKKTQTGDVVDKFIEELWSSKPLKISTYEQEISEALLVLGDYELTVRSHGTNCYSKFNLKVTENSPNFVLVPLDEHEL